MNVKRKVTWKDIFNNFKSVYPRLSKEAQDYRPYNYMSIVVYLADGTKVGYDDISILCASCYTIRATQSNNEIAFEGITLVKSVFSFTRTLERRRDCVATIRDALFRCVSQIGAHFLFALNSYLSMERVIIWERNQIKTFRVS